MSTEYGSDTRKNTLLLVQAAKNGHVSEVIALIPLSNPKSKNSEALRLAAEAGKTECVKLLIPVSDPKARDSEALFWATLYDQPEAMKLLIPVSDYQFVLNTYSGLKGTPLLQQCIDEHEALLQKERLTNELDGIFEQSNSLLKRKL